MNRPQDRNLEHLLASSLMKWSRSGQGWVDRGGNSIARFRPLEEKSDARLIVERMAELGFRFEDRRVEGVADDGAVLVSFFRGGEVYSALGAGECQAICTAASRFVMHRAGSAAVSSEKASGVEKREEIADEP